MITGGSSDRTSGHADLFQGAKLLNYKELKLFRNGNFCGNFTVTLFCLTYLSNFAVMKTSDTGNQLPHRIPFPNNMGVVRYVLAFSVVIAHFNELADFDFTFPISSFTAVGGFFALSGFLIYPSFLRRPVLKNYIMSRVRRLLPAYWLTVIGFAVGLVAVSTLSVPDYFTSGEFWKYLAANLSFLNFIEPGLPGVFTDTEVPDVVNGSLWTMKVEWALYLSVPVVVAILSRLKGRRDVQIVGIILLSMGYRLLFRYLYDATDKEIYDILGHQFLGQFCYFYTGVLCYLQLPRFLKYKWSLLCGSLLLILFSEFIPYSEILIHPVAVPVVVIWFSIVGKWGTWEAKKDNVSYNVYLVHFPVIQLFAIYLQKHPVPGWAGLAICCVLSLLLSFAMLPLEKAIRDRLIKN